MLPVSETGLIVILGLTAVVTVAGFSFMAVLLYKTMKSADEADSIADAVIDLIYYGDEKSRTLLLDPNWPPLRGRSQRDRQRIAARSDLPPPR